MLNKLNKFAAAAAVAAAVGLGLGAFSVAAAANVSTDGSTSMEKVIGILSESYHNANSDIQVTYNPTGSGAGISAAQEERCDIGLASRFLKDEEKKTLDETVIAKDGIVLVVNNENQIDDLTIEQIAGLFKGETKNWKELGGADAPVVLIGREAGSGTRDGFESTTGTKDKCQYRQELTSTGDVITTVSQNPNAIGYASLSALSSKVKGVKVGGVAASEGTIMDGSYKLQRPFVMVTLKGKALNADAQKFFDYVISKEAAPLIEKAGVFPVNK